MNSDKKISVNKKEMRLFIDDRLYPDMADAKTDYDFLSEFEKTKKNKSYRLIFLMIGTICAVVASTYILTAAIDNKNKEITVDINAFEDLNLNKLLDRVSRAESKLVREKGERESLETQFNAEVQQLQNRQDSELFTLNSMNLPTAEIRSRSAAVKRQYNEQIKELENNFQTKAAELDQTIAYLQKELTDIDSANVRRAQEQQAVIDSQRALFELEKQQMEGEYRQQIVDLNQQLQSSIAEGFESQKKAVETVSRQYQHIISGLDPVFSDQRGDLLTEQFAEKTQPQIADFPQVVLNETDLLRLEQLRQNITDLEYISDFLIKIPQKNSAPHYAVALRGVGYGIAENAASLLLTSMKELQKEQALAITRQQDIAKLQLAIENLNQNLNALTTVRNTIAERLSQADYYLEITANSSGDAGFILDARDKNRMAVFISPLYADLANETEAYIINRAGDLIASVILKKTQTGFFAVPLPEAGAESLTAVKENDRILLQLTAN